MSGTSQAAAVVTGLVALMQQRQWMTPDDTKCRLMASARTATDLYGKPVYTVFQQGAGLINAEAAVYGTAQGCANRGLDIAADIAGTRHYRGPAKKDSYGKYYLGNITGPGYSWTGSYAKGSNFTWNDVYTWNESFVWNETFLWNESFVWNDVHVWTNVYDWNDSLTEAVAINAWVPQE